MNCNLVTAYFKLLANAFGLGTVIMSYPAEVLQELGIPYARGVQRDRGRKIHRYTKNR